MGLSSTCRNCGLSKTMDYYGENFCKECTEAVTEARKKAIDAKADPGDAQREVLAERAHDTHRGRISPNQPMTRADYWAAGQKTGEEGIVVLVVLLLILMFTVVYAALPPN